MSALSPLFGFDPPDLTPDEALAIAQRHWGVDGSPRRLRGERSNNTCITEPNGRAFVLHVLGAGDDAAVVDLQTCAMFHLERRVPDVPVPRVVPTLGGSPLAEVGLGGRTGLARLVTFIPGTTFDPTEQLATDAYRRIGRLFGRIAAGLADFEHPAAAHFMPWDLANGLVVDHEMRADLTRSSAGALLSIDHRLEAVADAMNSLPRRIIHNDGHAGNLVRHDATSQHVGGVIDFGDLVHTVAAADVAIIAESFAPDHPRPAEVVAAITAGYHAEVAFADDEMAAVPELVLVRTALNVLLAEYQIRHAPHLAHDAQANLAGVTARLLRWSELDRGAIVGRIHEAIDANGPSRPTEVAS